MISTAAVVGVAGVIVVVVAGKLILIEVLHGIPCCCCCGDRGVVVKWECASVVVVAVEGWDS